MILLGDQWALTAQDLRVLLSHWQETPDKIIASSYFDKKQNKQILGPPTIFPRSYFSHLSELKETGARKLLLKYPDNVIQVELKNAGFDLDTPEDLEQFKHYFQGEKT